MADADGGADAERELPPPRAGPGRGARHLALSGRGRLTPCGVCGMLTPARHEEAARCRTCRGRRSSSRVAIPASGSRRPRRWPAMGARVLVTARNADKGRAAVAAIAQRLDGDGQVQLVVFDLADLLVGAAGRGRDPRAGAAARRAGQQRRPRPDRADRDGRRLRGDLRHEPPRPVPPDQPAARPAPRVGAVPHRQRGVDGALRGPQGDPLRRPPVDEALPRHAGVRAVEAGQHPLHPGAGPAARGHGRDRQLAASRHGAHRATGRTATPGVCSPSGSRSPVPSSSRRPRVPAPRCTWPPPPRSRA